MLDTEEAIAIQNVRDSARDAQCAERVLNLANRTLCAMFHRRLIYPLALHYHRTTMI